MQDVYSNQLIKYYRDKNIEPRKNRLSQKCINYGLSMGVKYPFSIYFDTEKDKLNRSNNSTDMQSDYQGDKKSCNKEYLYSRLTYSKSPLYIKKPI